MVFNCSANVHKTRDTDIQRLCCCLTNHMVLGLSLTVYVSPVECRWSSGWNQPRRRLKSFTRSCRAACRASQGWRLRNAWYSNCYIYKMSGSIWLVTKRCLHLHFSLHRKSSLWCCCLSAWQKASKTSMQSPLSGDRFDPLQLSVSPSIHAL